MRVVLTCMPFYSHLVPVVVPVAKALARAGHQVAVATANAMADELARAGVAHLPLPNVRTLAELMAEPAVAASPGMPDDPEGRSRAARARTDAGPLTSAFAGSLAGVFARDLIERCATWRPDLIVRECNEFGGYLAAERLGIRHAVLDIAPGSALNLTAVLDALNGEREHLGLAPVRDPWHPHRCLVAGFVPPRWYTAELPPVRCYRLDPPESAPVCAPAPGRPLVVAGLGSVAATVLPESTHLLELMVTALGRVPCSAVVGLGSDPAAWTGPRPPNVRLMAFTPQRVLLESAALLLSHGGFGGVAEAIRTATPMVVLPLFSDQPYNAATVAELGLGRRLDLDGLSAETLAEVCAEVVADDGYQRRADGMARQAQACPDLDALAADLAR
ncbi:glycosyltransferase [Amycolatopsis minnesotensis]|uniref:DUF1205 domain-containing protein n=1 Tax=Amycolatopsis minnesotensis TaxID=337894 RepID=A0ABN2SRQ8_9PSEU